jgi:hypothetical protein
MIKQTSLDAFVQLQAEGRLNANETIVHDVLCEYPCGLSNFKIAELLSWPINRVTGRVNSLVKKNKVFEFREEINIYTGKRNIVWVAAKAQPTLALFLNGMKP